MRKQTRVEEEVMRGIVAREHRKAVQERHEAEAAYRDAHTPPPARAGWSTKPGRKRRPGALAMELQATREQRRREWSAQHPESSCAERALRVEHAEVEKRWDHKRAGTAPTYEAAKNAATRAGSLARLYLSGAIDADELAAAVEIATVAERIGADIGIRTASLETRIDTTRHGDGGFHEKLSRVRHEVAYGRWRIAILRLGPAGAILDMLTGDTVGFSVVARRYGMHHRRAKTMLIRALELWRRILSDVVKEIDAAALKAAHAEILG